MSAVQKVTTLLLSEQTSQGFSVIYVNRSCTEHYTVNISNGSNEEGSDRFLQPLLFQPRTVFTDGGGISMTSWKWTSSAHQLHQHSLMLLY
jgi:hypothetical protein